VAAEERVRCERSVRELPPPVPAPLGLTSTCFQKERRLKMPWEGGTSHGATSPRSSTFTHGAADRYRFYRVRELRPPVREYRPGSIGVHRTRKRSDEEKEAICLASRGPRCL
jgi:hypothetical protein